MIGGVLRLLLGDGEQHRCAGVAVLVDRVVHGANDLAVWVRRVDALEVLGNGFAGNG